MKTLPVAIVLPCLNEEETLLATCSSLGFGTGARAGGEVHLFIVDNGSSDRTLSVAQTVKADSPPGSVTIGHERERGYVPPRHSGVELARTFARTTGWSDALVLQADADTTYSPGYVEELRTVADAAGNNVLLEAAAEFPPNFRSAYSGYVELCAEVDTRVLSRLTLPDSYDLICNDSVCAYRLSDYVLWEGHVREYTTGGDEIHAETTRLFMRSLTRGSRKVRVPDSVAYQSARKSLLRPEEEFATAGYPREDAWREAWRACHTSEADVSSVSLIEPGNPHFEEAVRVRERHLLALFGILPLHVFRALGRHPAGLDDSPLRHVAAELPARDREALFRRPGVFIQDVLALVDNSERLLPDV